MKMKITTFFKGLLTTALVASTALLPSKLSAQICGATSYGCYVWSGTNYYGGKLRDITVKNSAGTVLGSWTGLSCVSGSLVTLNTGAPISVTAGERLTIELSAETNLYGWGTYAGVWINADYNNTFSTAECVANPQGGQFSSVATTPSFTSGTVVVPCVASTGNTQMRIRSGTSVYPTGLTISNGCNQANTYGDQYDILLSIGLASNPTVDFTFASGTLYTNQLVKLTPRNQASYANYTWSATGSGVFSPNRFNASPTVRWSACNTYTVKMIAQYCTFIDSIERNITITCPTSAPVADFVANKNIVEIFEPVQLTDLSTFGPNSWNWEITPPTNAAFNITGTNFNIHKNPVFFPDETGQWSICLTSTNGIGPSSKVCKTKYIDVTAPVESRLGPDKSSSRKNGRLVDDGGANGPYSANNTPSIHFFKIQPCGATEIRLTFQDLQLFNEANDFLTIYDGPDQSGTVIAVIRGNDQARWRTATIKAFSGAMYITMNSSSSNQDRGFIANWDSDLASPKSPKAKWELSLNCPAPLANGVLYTFLDKSTDIQGIAEYQWIDATEPDPNDWYIMNTNKDLNWSWSSDGTYTVMLRVRTCNGVDTFRQNVTIATPTAGVSGDFKSANRRPKVNELVTIETSTCDANRFEWSIFPTTFSYVNGTNSSSRNPQLRFQAGGCYTFTLKAWNAAGTRALTEATIIKNKYICVVDPCRPSADLNTQDVGINSVKVTNSTNTTTLINNTSTSGTGAFQDFSNIRATVTFGATYNFEIKRETNANAINYKVWVDWNIDGDFNDVGEEVYASGMITGTMVNGSFVVPPLAQSFEGPTLMRVGASYSNFSNTPCGPNTVGEYEDYTLVLANDNLPPVITLTGGDTVYVERNSNSTACWSEIGKYMALDPTEGDLTSKVDITSDLDCTVPGIYEALFNVCDASGNCAQTKRRTIYVVLDKTAPTLTLIAGNVTTVVEQCGTYNEPGFSANDAVDGDLTSAVLVSGSVNTNVVGDYTLTYMVSDAQGNSVTKTRTVQVRDRVKPTMYFRGNPIVNGSTVNVQIGSTFVDEVVSTDPCNGAILSPYLRKVAGFNGEVNTLSRATYPVQYFAVDPNGNTANEEGFIINYKVDDYIAPEVVLNTDETIIHDVNTPYTSKNVTVSDNYYALNKISVVKTGSVDPYTLGTYTETYCATDESGNQACKTRTVQVVDRIAPQILAPAANTCIGTPFWWGAGLILSDNYYSPSTLTPLVKLINHNVNIWEVGVYYMNYQVTDPSNNTSLMVTRPVFVNYPPNCQVTYLANPSTNLKDGVKMFPNPTSGKLTMNYNLANNSPVTVEVSSLDGKQLFSTTLKGGFGGTVIDLSKYSNGIYMVRLVNENQVVTEKIQVSK